MDAAIVHEKAATIYDYHRCMKWTTSSMLRPSIEHAHDGKWACNGEYHWRALSNGRDPNKDKYPNISDVVREWQPIQGSITMFCFAPARARTTLSSTSCSARLYLASTCTAVPRTMPIAPTSTSRSRGMKSCKRRKRARE